jgi:Ran-binding protein 1
VKLLQNKESRSIRLLLRQEKTLKLCMNHKVHPEIELVANAGSDRSWTWRTMDYSSEEGEKQTFALRFKDAEAAIAFKNEYDTCRATNATNDKEKGVAAGAPATEAANATEAPAAVAAEVAAAQPAAAAVAAEAPVQA